MPPAAVQTQANGRYGGARRANSWMALIPDKRRIAPTTPTERLDGRPTARDHAGMRLLEREAALAALDEYAADACAGDGRLVLVAGEAGVGKTALVAALRERRPDAR